MYRAPLSYPAIEDYALIGDCRTAALVSTDGAIEWLCLPRFDSPSVFTAILDREDGGAFYIRAATPYRVERRYLGDSNVLETRFETETGVLRLVDLMPVSSEEEKTARLQPEREILRKVECVEGSVEVEVLYDPRFNYASRIPDLEWQGKLGLFCGWGAETLALRSDLPLTIRPDAAGAMGRTTLEEGETRYACLTYAHSEPVILPELGEQAEARIDRSVAWWEEWADQCQYEGPYRDAVVRSALTLKLMTYAPSGAIIAAPTTSLPEKKGGVRNWDYRYCWIRDASMTLTALLDLGFEAEGTAFLDWLMHATWLTQPALQVLYDVYGETRVRETNLEHLEGYRGSRPVRIGNGASTQLQLDVYGEIVDAAYVYVKRGGTLDHFEEKMLVSLGDKVARSWRDPDEGIWEIRSGRHHHTHSKMMCWVALDRLVRLHEHGHVNVPVESLAEERSAIREAIERNGFNEELNSYVSEFGGEVVDASLLLMAIHGYQDASHPRMKGTIELIRERLGENGLIYRYPHSVDDGLPPGEGAFGICTFWMVACRALQGDLETAREEFEHVLSFRNEVGLLAEEIDPESGAALGNFPQAFTHIGLIHAARLVSGWDRDGVASDRSFGSVSMVARS